MDFLKRDPTTGTQTVDSTTYTPTDSIGAPNGVAPLDENQQVPQQNIPQNIKDKNYVHIQNTTDSLWTVNHNLGKYPSIEVTDSAGSSISANVQHTDLNTAIVVLAFALSGRAFCN